MLNYPQKNLWLHGSELMTGLYSQKVIIEDNILMRELDGESVILDLSSENYFGLDDIGTRMWQVLAESNNVKDAYDILLEEYDVAPEQLQQDLREFITDLFESGLVKLEKDTRDG